jgi:hypothetical protein
VVLEEQLQGLMRNPPPPFRVVALEDLETCVRHFQQKKARVPTPVLDTAAQLYAVSLSDTSLDREERERRFRRGLHYLVGACQGGADLARLLPLPHMRRAYGSRVKLKELPGGAFQPGAPIMVPLDPIPGPVE